MASISNDGNGRRRLLFIGTDGERRAVRLGKVTAKQAESVKLRVEHLVAAASLGAAPDPETARWVAHLDDQLYARLAAVGLVSGRLQTPELALAPFIDQHIADRTDAKPRTIINLKQARADLVKFFGEDKAIGDVTEGEVDEFWRWMIRPESVGGRGLSANTARRVIGRAKQYFRVAVRKRLVTSNPFADVKSKVQGNPEREFFITRDMAAKVLAECPDAEWRAIFALSRFGGLRCPSEHLSLKWSDINWEHNRITVHSPKTEHHQGHESRQLPLFPELRTALLELFEQASEGVTHVLAGYRDGNANLRTQFRRIIERAGLSPWPKLFHNLRATRQTELAETFPIHVVCAWLGNSEAIAKKHYLQITDEHFAAAVKEPAEKAAHNPAQQAAATSGIERQSTSDRNVGTPVLPGSSAECFSLPNEGIPPRGVEPLFSG